MTADSEIRSRYLALALDARRIMDVLVPFAENGQVDQALDASVRDVIGALHSLGETADINPVRSSLAFDEYEQVLTVEEVKPREDRKAVIQDLQTILDWMAPRKNAKQQFACCNSFSPWKAVPYGTTIGPQQHPHTRGN